MSGRGRNRHSQSNGRGVNRIRRNRRRQSRRGTNDPAPGEEDPQFFHGAIDTHLGRIFACSQGRTDFFHAPAIKETQRDGIVVRFAQSSHRRVQEGRDLRPDLRFAFVQQILHVRLLFAPGPADFAANEGHR